MKKASFFILALTLVFAVACKGDKKESETTTETTYEVSSEKYTEGKITISLESKSSSNVIGNVIFTQEGDIVTMVATMSGLSQGTHAIHLHEKADCSSDDGKSSGGHWNPTAQPHGKWGATEGFHLGDIGNFEADLDGNGSITFTSNQWCIGCSNDSKDIIGKAIIVHEGTDDFTSQPSGAAGTRVSCGGVIQ